jgi:hypothetical protein
MASVTALAISDAARQALLGTLEKYIDYDALVTVVWSEFGWVETPKADGSVERRDTGPDWSVAFHRRDKVPASEVVTIAGIDFYFDQGSISERLNGKTLNYRGGFFYVE